MTTKPARRIEYLPLDDLTEDERNPKDHDLGTVHVSISRFGMIDPIVRDERTGKLISGHGRRQALTTMRDRGETPPEGIRLDKDGNWLAPVLTGWASRSDTEAGAALIALNRTTELGGWVDNSLLDLLTDIATTPDGLEGVGYDAEDMDRIARYLDAHEVAGTEPEGTLADDQIELGGDRCIIQVIVPPERETELYALLADIDWIIDARQSRSSY